MKKILLIGEEKPASRKILNLLIDSGYGVTVCENGKRGILSAKETVPDMIICNAMLPDMDGCSVLSELNRYTETAAIPFIVLSGRIPSLSEVRRAMLMGADDYLFKPFDPEELLKTIQTRIWKYEKIIKKEENKIKQENGRLANKKKLTEEDHILLKAGSNPEIVKIRNIVFISAAHEYSSVYLSQKKNILVQRQLKEWERLLPEKVFLRIHRSTIINLNYVSKMEKWFNHSFRLYLKEIPQGFVTSRRYSTKLRSLLSL